MNIKFNLNFALFLFFSAFVFAPIGVAEVKAQEPNAEVCSIEEDEISHCPEEIKQCIEYGRTKYCSKDFKHKLIQKIFRYKSVSEILITELVPDERPFGKLVSDIVTKTTGRAKNHEQFSIAFDLYYEVYRPEGRFTGFVYFDACKMIPTVKDFRTRANLTQFTISDCTITADHDFVFKNSEVVNNPEHLIFYSGDISVATSETWSISLQE